MTIVSYAQNLEDIMLWRAFKNIPNGFYIDIGANDPVLHSVSNLFYQKGWRGIHIEPCQEYADNLRQARPDEIVKQIALSDHVGEADFYEIPSTGLSTMCFDVAEQHVKRGFTVIKTKIAVDTLDNVLADITNEIHWLKIDVEGAEKEILEGWKESLLRPWMLVIESTLPLSQINTYSKWEDIVIRKGYKFVYFDGLNRFYVHEQHIELKQYFNLPVNVFDDFILFNRLELEETVKQLNANINIEQTEKQKLIADRQKLITDRQKLITDRQKLIVDKQKLIVDKQNLLLEKEKLVVCKRKLLNDKNESSTQITYLQTSLANKQKQLELTSSKINTLLNSRSWRITAFLRWTAEYLRHIKQAVLHNFSVKPKIAFIRPLLLRHKTITMNWFTNQIGLLKQHGFKSRIKAFIKKSLRSTIHLINKYPKIKSKIIKISRSIGAYDFLCSIYHKTITTIPAPIIPQGTVDIPVELSLWSARIYREIENKSDKEAN